MVWTPRVTVAAVIERDGRFLMVEERKEGRPVFNQPAGHLEAGESLLQAIGREVLEETAHPFKPRGLVGVYRWVTPAGGDTYLRFCFTGTVGERDAGRDLDPDIVDTHWLDAPAIRALEGSLRSPLVLRCLHDALTLRASPLELLHDLAS
jgi:ADP-ribose pyrophosphatase YjhB (NUDIX family)